VFASMTLSAVLFTAASLLPTTPDGPTRPLPTPRRMPSARVLDTVLFSSSTFDGDRCGEGRVCEFLARRQRMHLDTGVTGTWAGRRVADRTANLRNHCAASILRAATDDLGG
jgi:hypothetical protein